MADAAHLLRGRRKQNLEAQEFELAPPFATYPAAQTDDLRFSVGFQFLS